MLDAKADLQKEPSCDVNCYIEDDDPQTVVFAYNRSFDDSSILPVIRFEIGTLAVCTPAEEKPITSPMTPNSMADFSSNQAPRY